MYDTIILSLALICTQTQCVMYSCVQPMSSAMDVRLLHHHRHHAGRRASKIVSLITSCFTSAYVRHWPHFFPATDDAPALPLKANPMFDGRAVLYPEVQTVRDYLSWRQVDTHVNNQVGVL